MGIEASHAHFVLVLFFWFTVMVDDSEWVDWVALERRLLLGGHETSCGELEAIFNRKLLLYASDICGHI